jgi:hypothetical protein
MPTAFRARPIAVALAVLLAAADEVADRTAELMGEGRAVRPVMELKRAGR